MKAVVNHLKTKLAAEERTLARRKDEITVDFAEVKAEIRAECLREIVRYAEANHGPERQTL